MINALESLLAAAILLSTAGGTLVTTGKVWEGLACIVVSAGLIYYRGTQKVQ